MREKTIQKEISEHLIEGRSDRATCSICGRQMPKYIHRIEEMFHAVATTRSFRICEACILKLAKHTSQKRINRWKEELMLKDL